MTFSITLAGDAPEDTEKRLLQELRDLKKKYTQISYARMHGTYTGIIHFSAEGETSQEVLDATKINLTGGVKQ
jgi:hypothetical protein